MRKFKGEEHFDIADRGHVITVTLQNDEDHPEIGSHVDIDGTIYKVRGVEFMGFNPYIGILVKPVLDPSFDEILKEYETKHTNS